MKRALELGEDLPSFRRVVFTLHCTNCNITCIQSSYLGNHRTPGQIKVEIRALFPWAHSKVALSGVISGGNRVLLSQGFPSLPVKVAHFQNNYTKPKLLMSHESERLTYHEWVCMYEVSRGNPLLPSLSGDTNLFSTPLSI